MGGLSPQRSVGYGELGAGAEHVGFWAVHATSRGLQTVISWVRAPADQLRSLEAALELSSHNRPLDITKQPATRLMDPFSSLSIAAAIVQFLEFGTKLVSGTYEIYRSRNGLADELSELSQRTERIGEFASGLAGPSTVAQDPPASPGSSKSLNVPPDSSSQEPKFESFAPASDFHGPSAENQYQPDQACRKLTRLAASLQSSTSTPAASATLMPIRRSEKEEALVAMASACKTTADDLRQAISKMSVDNKRFKAFNSFRQALQKQWGNRKLKNLESNLEKHRSDLALHLVAIIKYVKF